MSLIYTIDDLFEDNLPISIDLPELADTPSSVNQFTDGITGQAIKDGELGGNLQSNNFVTNSAGWKLTSEGDFEGETGNFRGGTIYIFTARTTIDATTTPQAVIYHQVNDGVTLAGASGALLGDFIGFVIKGQSVVSGDLVKVAVGGVVIGFSGLTPGYNVYISDTLGAISNTPGTYQTLVGNSVATDKVLIYTGTPRFAMGSYSDSWVAGAGTQVMSIVTVIGFRPRIIEVWGELDDVAITRPLHNLESSAGQVIAPAFWVNGVYSGWNKNSVTGAIEDITDALLSTDNNAGETIKLTVEPTTRSITVYLTKTGTDAQTFYYKFYWRVSG